MHQVLANRIKGNFVLRADDRDANEVGVGILVVRCYRCFHIHQVSFGADLSYVKLKVPTPASYVTLEIAEAAMSEVADLPIL